MGFYRAAEGPPRWSSGVCGSGAPAHGVLVTGVPYVPQILEQQREEAGLVLTEGSGRAGAACSRVDGDGLAAELGRSSRRKVL